VRFVQHGAAGHASAQPGGVLTVFPGDDPAGVPFPIARVFTITGVARGGSRGNHAHRVCTQLVTCLAGEVEVAVDDGRQTRNVVLSDAGTGLLIPPGLWNSITFAGPETLLAVFCDRPYEESDYIRDRGEFLRAGQ
jgi:hypothetical protein